MVAIGAAIRRQSLIDEILAMPNVPQLALSLQFKEKMSYAEIAAVLNDTHQVPGCTPRQYSPRSSVLPQACSRTNCTSAP